MQFVKLIRLTSTTSSYLFSILSGTYLFGLYIVSIVAVVALLSLMQIKDAMIEAKAFNVENLREIKGNAQTRVNRIYAEIEHNDKIYKAQIGIESAAKNVASIVGLTDYEFNGYTFFPAEFEKFPQVMEFKLYCADQLTNPDEVCGAWIGYTAALEKKAKLFEDGEAERFAAFESEKLQQMQEIKDQQEFDQFSDSLMLLDVVPQFENLISLPVEILTLLLIMVMGLLGSVITMTWSYVKQDENLAARRFLIMPFIGSMSALVVLIFIRAGQLTVNAGDATVQLDIFFVSFLGIVSGMLSERAYAKISSIGTNFFATGDDVKRWAIGLEAAMDKAGLPAVEVSSMLGIPEDQVKEIMMRAKSATPEQQTLLAVALRMRKADLFSDLPPA